MADEIGDLIAQARDMGYDHFYLDCAGGEIFQWEVILNPDAGPNAKPRRVGEGATLVNALKAAISLAKREADAL